MSGVSQDAIRQFLNNNPQESRRSSGSGDITWFDLPKDTTKTVVRLLPDKDNASGMIGKTVKYHYNITPSDPSQKWEKVLCMKTHSAECPICNILNDYETRLGEKVDQFRSDGTFYVNAMVLKGHSDSAKDFNKVVLLKAKESFMYWMYQEISERGAHHLDPKSGRDIIIARERDKGKFNYSWELDPRPVGTSDDEIKAVLDKCIDTHKMWRRPDDDYYQKHIVGGRDRLKAQLENLLLTAGTQPTNNPNVAPPAPPATQAAPAPAENATGPTPPHQQAAIGQQAPATQNAGGLPFKIPPKSPECFAKKSVYGDDRTECITCPYQYDCGVAIQKHGGR